MSGHDIQSGAVAIVLRINTNCKTPLQETLAKTMEQNGGRIPCLIYDSFMYFVEEVASHLCLPSIMLRTSNATNMLAHKILPKLKLDGLYPVPDLMSLETVPHQYPLRFKDLPTFFDREGFLELVAKASEITTSRALVFNTMEFLEGPSLATLRQQYRIPVFPIGPLHKVVPASFSSLLKQESKCITWLDKQKDKSVIYVSLESLAYLEEKALLELAWDLAGSNHPFLLVLRPDLMTSLIQSELMSECFREAVGERGCIVHWAPQKKVLAHRAVMGFWSHCGWNSTLESISEGVPMICQPFFGDQTVNARYLAHVWKAGIIFAKEMTREKIGETMRRIVAEKEGEEMTEKVTELKEEVNRSVHYGGSSYNSLNELVEFIRLLIR